MLLKAKNCVRCGIKFTTGNAEIHAEYRPKDERALDGYVTWCGDCYPQKNMPIPDGYRKSPTGLVKNVSPGVVEEYLPGKVDVKTDATAERRLGKKKK